MDDLRDILGMVPDVPVERLLKRAQEPAEPPKEEAPGDSPKSSPYRSVMGMSARDREFWWDVVPPEEIDAQYAKNYDRIKEAEEKAKDPNRPLYILLVSCSGRNDKESCAREQARSNITIQEVGERFIKVGAKILLIDLWDLNIEHCNGCYGSHDAWCHWPCTCWPFDDMHDLYVAFSLADAIVIGSPVNEASAASRFYEMWHRMISMDGGMDFKPPSGWKKTKEELKVFQQKYGPRKGIKHVLRWANKPFGFIVMGHEIGAQTAQSQMAATVYYRGGYVPPGCAIPKIYAGAGPNHIDDEILKGPNVFRKELNEELDYLVVQMMDHAKRYRTLPRTEDGGDRT